MAYLYVTEQGAVVRKSADRYLVEAGGRILLDLPYHKLESILLFGRVQITTQALHAMLERGIQVGLFSRQGRYRGALAPVRGKQVDLRLKQFELYQDSTRSLGYARAVLRAKIANGLEVLRRYAERAGQSADSENRRAALEHALEALPATQALESMLGFEGTAARIYFEGLGDYNRSGFAWDGREKRPSPDPLNAALSLTYALLTHEMAGALEGLGLDPHVGFLHRIDYGRPSLALDLVEPLRHPAADRLVWTVMNRRTFAKEDFVSSPDRGGVVFTQAALKAFLAEYERWMLAESAPARSFRRAIRAQAEAFVGALRNGGGFDPFDWKQHLEGPPPCSTSSATT